MKNQVEFKKIREFGEIIGDSFLFIKQNFKPLLKAFFYLCGLFIIGSLLSSLLTQLQVAKLASGAGYDRSYGSPFNTLYNLAFNYVLVFLFMLLNYTAMYACILSYIAIYIEKGNVAPKVEEVWGYFRYYFFRIFGSILGLTLIVGIITGVLFFLMYSINPMLGVIAVLIFILPFFCYIFPALTLFYPTMIMENGSLWYSLGRAFKLLKSNWWITAATILVIYVIFYACSLIVYIPSIVISMISAFSHLQQPITKTYAIASTVASSISHIFLIIPMVCSALIYFNLVERKESSGLLNRIEEFGGTPVQNNSIPEEY